MIAVEEAHCGCAEHITISEDVVSGLHSSIGHQSGAALKPHYSGVRSATESGADLRCGVFLVYMSVIELEEPHLRKLLPEYDVYARRVPALVPTIRRTTAGGEFRWSRELPRSR
jgi:hypothetical protein